MPKNVQLNAGLTLSNYLKVRGDVEFPRAKLSALPLYDFDDDKFLDSNDLEVTVDMKKGDLFVDRRNPSVVQIYQR